MYASGNIKLLFVSGDRRYFESLKNSLSVIKEVKLDIASVDSFDTGLQVVKDDGFDLVILDLGLNKETSLKIVKIMTSSFPELPLIALAEDEDIQLAVGSMRYGAHDYLLKSQLDAHVLFTAIRYTIERKKTEKFHREQIHFLQSVMDNIPSPLYLKGTDLVLGACNLALENVLGLPKSEIIGRSVFEIFDKQTSEFIRQNELKLLSGECTQSYELSIPGQNGRDAHFIFYETTHRRADGKLAGLIGVGIDVTELKNKEAFLSGIKNKLELEVRERTETLAQVNDSLRKSINKRKQIETHLKRERNIFVNGPVIVFRCRATEGNRAEYVSSNITRLGYSPGEFISGGMSLFDIIHPNDREGFINEVRRRVNNRACNFEFKLRVLCRNREDVRKVNAYIAIVRNEKNIVTYFDGYIIDITGWDIC